MLALYRCDRAAEALQVYRQARRTMIDELGIEPGERLQQLEHAILACDPALDPPASPLTIQPATWQIPSLLPADIADFTGRAEQIEQIDQRLPPTQRTARPGNSATGSCSPIYRVSRRIHLGRHAPHGPPGAVACPARGTTRSRRSRSARRPPTGWYQR